MADDDETVYKWWVPLTYRTASSSAPSAVWINETLTTGVDFGASSTDWLLANVDQMGPQNGELVPVSGGKSHVSFH